MAAIQLDPWRNIVNVGWDFADWTVLLIVRCPVFEAPFPFWAEAVGVRRETPLAPFGIGHDGWDESAIWNHHIMDPAGGDARQMGALPVTALPPDLQGSGVPTVPWQNQYMIYLGRPWPSVSGPRGGDHTFWLNTPLIFGELADDLPVVSGRRQIRVGIHGVWRPGVDDPGEPPPSLPWTLIIRAWPFPPENWDQFAIAEAEGSQGVVVHPEPPALDLSRELLVTDWAFAAGGMDRRDAAIYQQNNDGYFEAEPPTGADQPTSTS